jgi:hypothetical protein
MAPGVIKPTIPAGERAQPHALNNAITAIRIYTSISRTDHTSIDMLRQVFISFSICHALTL